MSTGVARRLTGHALVFVLAWLLYQGIAPMIQGAHVEQRSGLVLLAGRPPTSASA